MTKKSMMNKQNIIEQTKQFVREKLGGEGSGHDWWHVLRVYNNAVNIANDEKDADIFIIELAALLHDIADWKFHDGNHHKGGEVAANWLKTLSVDGAIINRVADIVNTVSFKGLGEKSIMQTLEGKIVQDADRLDAIGAIGIGRAFAYGGYAKREMYNPEEKPMEHKTFDEYKKSKSNTINHFHEKLLHLKGLMNTESGKKRALKRHQFMSRFLNEFHNEWEGL